MFTDARHLPDDSDFDCDICIIGSGPVGITLATSLAHTGLQICLSESGGFTPGETPNSPIAEQLENRVLVLPRTKFFGGMSNAWGGYFGSTVGLTPLDPIDFEVRDWVPHSGWPFQYQELVPFYKRACEIMGQIPFEQFDCERHQDRMIDAFNDSVLRSKIFQLPKPIRFGQQYRDSLAQSQNINVVLNSRAVEIEEAETDDTIRFVRSISTNGRKHRFSARYFVLACGGLETTRLLLASKRKRNCGVGNEHDLVGRFYMQHPKGLQGHVNLCKNNNPDLYTAPGCRLDGVLTLGGIAASDQFQRRERMLNSAVGLAPCFRLSESYAARLYSRLRSTWRHQNPRRALLEGVVAATTEAPRFGAKTVRNTVRSVSRGMMQFRVANFLEQIPNADSRLELSDHTDGFGVPKLRTKWKINQLDKSSMCRMHDLLRDNLQSYGIGELRDCLNPKMKKWPITTSSSHDLGTTRMHDDPRQGVTDANGRVHSVENLYVGGGALFPTSGNANPTLTIVALALRLADHIADLTGTSHQANQVDQEA